MEKAVPGDCLSPLAGFAKYLHTGGACVCGFLSSGQKGETPGFPRRKAFGQYESFCFPGSSVGYQVVNGGLKLSKITEPNQTIKMKLHRPLLGKVKTCCIHKVNSKWFVCFSVEQEEEPLPATNLSVGLDMGLRTFATLSTGEQIENPRFFRTDEPALAKAARRQAKQKKGSFARKKCNKVLARIHERIRNRRHNFCHQEARKIVNRYGLIAIENLNIKGMVKNHSLAKSISDAAWSQFLSLIIVKAESAGCDASGTGSRTVAKVNPAYTSQDCHQCGYRAKKKLSERWHLCPICGASLDRDHNAAINILNLALTDNLTRTIVSQVTPVEAPAFTHGE